MGRQEKAYALGLAAALTWSTVATAFKLSLRHLNPVELLFYSSGVSVLVLAAVLAAQGRIRLVFDGSSDQYLRSLALGFLNPFLYYLVLFKAYDLLPAQEAQPLNYTWAITLGVLSAPLLGQKLGLRDLGAGLVSYAGVVVIATHGNVLSLRFSDPLGVALALGSTVIWALYWIYNARDDRDPVAALLLNFVAGWVFILLFSLFTGALGPPSLPGLAGAAYVGVFEMGITFVVWLTALRLTESTARIANLIFLSPFLSLVFIRFFVGEAILPSSFAGLVLIVGGLLIQRRGARG
jgi:drug/metabolite transporter (DMT)-like permease